MLSDFSEFFFQWDRFVGGFGCYLSYESCGQKGLLATGKDLWISDGSVELQDVQVGYSWATEVQ